MTSTQTQQDSFTIPVTFAKNPAWTMLAAWGMFALAAILFAAAIISAIVNIFTHDAAVFTAVTFWAGILSAFIGGWNIKRTMNRFGTVRIGR